MSRQAFSRLRDAVSEMSDRDRSVIVKIYVEEATPDEFFTNPKSDRAKDFLGKILNH